MDHITSIIRPYSDLVFFFKRCAYMKHGPTLVMVNLLYRNTDIWIWLETYVLFSVVMAAKMDCKCYFLSTGRYILVL